MVGRIVDDDGRGQTHVDFIVAIVIFIVTVAFVIAFIPQIVAPFDDPETPVVADRVAADLAGTLLAASEPPSALDEACTVAFFEWSGGPGCAFDTAQPRHEQLGVPSRYEVNVTLRRNVTGGPDLEVLCHDGGSIGACGTDRLAAGPPVPGDSRSVSTTRQVVILEDGRAVLEVNVW